MRRRAWCVMLLSSSVAAIALPGRGVAGETDGGADGSDVLFQVQIDPKRKGTIRCALYHDEKTWLGETSFRHAVEAPSTPWVTCRFPNVPEGFYAAAAFHDEDGNGKMNKNFLGIPTEGYAASRNAHVGVMGPPKWKAAVFLHRSERTLERAQMKY